MSYTARWSIPPYGGVRVRPLGVHRGLGGASSEAPLWENRRFWKPAAGHNSGGFPTLLREFPSRPVVDTSGPTLVAALEARVALVKANQAELANVMGRDSAGIEEAIELSDSTKPLFSSLREPAEPP